MNEILKVFLSMSFSGALLILAMFLGKRFLKNKISWQWWYYIWLIVIFRLLLPFGPETNLMGKTYQAAGQAITRTAPLSRQQLPLDVPDGTFSGLERDNKNMESPSEDLTTARPRQDIVTQLIDHIWLIWLAVALGMLIRKVTIYQSFIRYINAGSTPVSDIALLDRLSIAAEKAGVKKPVDLCTDPLISSPLLKGFFRPCIVVPSVDISEKDFQYIVLHELTHYKRRDMFYKWLVQVTICLHWFDPVVHLMGREITKACEFSCDEAVLAKMGGDSAGDYGKTLLNAMAAVGKYRENPGAVTLSENIQLLKERLGAIMNFKKKSRAIWLLTAVLTLSVIFSAAYIGVYSIAAPDAALPTPTQSDDSPDMETLELKGIIYYLISNEAQLRAIGTGEYSLDGNYMQQADIQMSADEWTPIGTWEAPFTGTFNGNGFEIRGLTMTDPDAKLVGLFGFAKNAQIYNVAMRDYDIEKAGRNVYGKSVGAIVAVNMGSRSYDNTASPNQTKKVTLSKIDQYYEADSIPLFAIAFSRLDDKAKKKWLEKLYTDGDYAFFNAAVCGVDTDTSLFAGIAEKAYNDEEISFFSILADRMDETELGSWLDRALEDGRWNFQSVLYDKLDMEDEWDAKEKEWAERQMAEYRAVGVTNNGKNYYYEGQLVNIFLDKRHDRSVYTLDMNPAGTVNIKIIRGEDEQITGVAYMTETEVTELLGDMEDPDDY